VAAHRSACPPKAVQAPGRGALYCPGPVPITADHAPAAVPGDRAGRPGRGRSCAAAPFRISSDRVSVRLSGNWAPIAFPAEPVKRCRLSGACTVAAPRWRRCGGGCYGFRMNGVVYVLVDPWL